MKRIFKVCPQFGTVILVAWVVTLAATLAVTSAVPAQSPLVLKKVDTTGLRLLDKMRVVAASGLRLGQRVRPADLDVALRRLADTGYFKTLNYQYRTNRGKMTVTFELEETDSLLPVIFDNFVGFSNQELDRALSQQNPLYSGKLSLAPAALNGAERALQDLLKKRGNTATVSYTFTTTEMKDMKLLFAVSGPTPRITALRFPGNASVDPEILQKAAAGLVGQPYSQTAATVFLKKAVEPIYLERGFLKVVIGTPEATRLASGKPGALLTVPITEDLQFHWKGASFSGNSMYSSDDLKELLDMKVGEVASGLQLKKGLEAIDKAYGRKGHLAVGIESRPIFEAESGQVSFQFRIDEGDEYRMGGLHILGVPAGEEKRLREKWELKSGQVFDSSYLQHFVDDVLQKELRAWRFMSYTTKIQTDPKNLSASVTLEIR